MTEWAGPDGEEYPLENTDGSRYKFEWKIWPETIQFDGSPPLIFVDRSLDRWTTSD